MTDDKKARRIAGELGVAVLSSPKAMRRWAIATDTGEAELAEVLAAIQRFSNHLPGRTTVGHGWWAVSLRLRDPK